MSAFFAPHLWPFTVAAGLVVALCAVEGLALLVGLSLSHWLDSAHDADLPDAAHAEGLSDSLLGWLHIGKVPILVLLVTFLTGFAVVGFVTQFIAAVVIGAAVPAVVAGAIAVIAAVMLVRAFGGLLARIIPKDETRALSDDTLVGRIATIVVGTATVGRPAQARLQDENGTTQYVMVEPEADAAFEQGASVLLVRRLSGRRFHAILNPKPELL